MPSGHQSRLASATSAASRVTEEQASRRRSSTFSSTSTTGVAVRGLASAASPPSAIGGVGAHQFAIKPGGHLEGLLGEVGRLPLCVHQRAIVLHLADPLRLGPSELGSKQLGHGCGRRGVIPSEQPRLAVRRDRTSSTERAISCRAA